MLKTSLILLLCCSAALCAVVKKEPTIQQPVDQTDIFAIPFDEDEQDQEEELKEMESAGKPK